MRSSPAEGASPAVEAERREDDASDRVDELETELVTTEDVIVGASEVVEGRAELVTEVVCLLTVGWLAWEVDAAGAAAEGVPTRAGEDDMLKR